jgi:hypothetical protein
MQLARAERTHQEELKRRALVVWVALLLDKQLQQQCIHISSHHPDAAL